MIGFTFLLTTLLSLSTLVPGSNLPVKHAHLHKKDAHVSQSGMKAIGYYVSWAIYGRNWPPQNIQSSALTHVLYAFAGINNKTGEAYLTDEFADIQKQFDGDVPDNKTTNLFGNIKQLYIHKKHNRNLKTLLSFGGWNLRTYFAPALANRTGRETFAKTSVQLLKDLGFDGLDIDWEYPNNTKQAVDLVDTCRLFRQELDNYSRNLTGNPHFLLTLAVPAGPDHYPYFDMRGLDKYVDFVNLMGYDYQGSFSNFSGHQANIYKSRRNPRSTDYSTQGAIDYYLGNQSYPAEKLTLGMPLYGRSFADTSGPGTRFSPAQDGSWENGVWDYKALPLKNASTAVYKDDTIVASWSYSNATHYMVSYDTPEIATTKAHYIEEQGMGGAMWWELSGDQPLNDTRSLIKTVTSCFKSFEQCENYLDYPYSKYKNLREGMPGQ